MLGTICTQLLNGLYREIGRGLHILETGTAFQTFLEPGETNHRERSTVAIASWLRDHPNADHSFNTVDLSEEHINASASMLAQYGLLNYVQHRHGTLEKVSSLLPHKFHFVLLDSDSGPETPYEEFQIVRERMTFNGIVIVDDAFKPPQVNKATYILQELARTGSHPWFDLRHQAAGIPFGPMAQYVLETYAKGN